MTINIHGNVLSAVFKNSISKDNIYESHEEYYNTGDDDSGLLRSIFKEIVLVLNYLQIF